MKKGKGTGKSTGKGNGKGNESNATSLGQGNVPMLPKLKGKEVIDEIVGDGETASGVVPKYGNCSIYDLKDAEQIAVGRISDLDRASGYSLSVWLLRVWTVIIKEGKRVIEVSSELATVTKFAAQKYITCKLHFSESFRYKFPLLVFLSTRTDGSWRIADEGQNAVEISNLDEYRHFLIKQRKFKNMFHCVSSGRVRTRWPVGTLCPPDLAP